MLNSDKTSLSSQESLDNDSSHHITLESVTNNDCLTKIIEASNLEKAGDIDSAVSLYRQVIENDREGTYKAIAKKALATLETYQFQDNLDNNKDEITSEKVASLSFKEKFLKRFYDLPIQTKQLGILLTSEIGAILIISNGRLQLVNQAKLELKVAEINYNLKIEQMELTFDSQGNNLAVIEAAEKKQANGILLTTLANEIYKQKI